MEPFRKTAATSEEVAAIIEGFGQDAERVRALADLMEYGPKYNRNVTENVLYALRFSGNDRDWFLRKAEAQAHFDRTGEWIPPIHPRDKGQQLSMEFESRRRTAAAEWTEVESQFLGNYPEYRARINGFTIILKWVVTQGNFEWRAWAGDPASFDSDGYVKFNFSDRLYDAKKSAERWASQRTASRLDKDGR